MSVLLAAPPALLYVCVRCDRHAPPAQAGHGAGEILAELLAARMPDSLQLRQVACLNGCPQACNVALRGAGRQTLRFSRVVPADLPALLEFAQRYWALAPGRDALPVLPAALHAKLSQNTPPFAAPVATS